MKIETAGQTAPEKELLQVESKPIYSILKRSFDILFSFLGLIVLFPVLLIISLVIVIDSPGASPIYIQNRVGKNGKVFRFYKFRTMVPNADQLQASLMNQNEMQGPVFKIRNDPRITGIGRFIRRTSIDELPQLFNILRGEMSFVGPRPPIDREVEQYTDYQRQRLSITPGLTCYWQVQPQRNSLSFDEWMELDLKYIRERSVWVDLVILFKTIGAVCGMEGE